MSTYTPFEALTPPAGNAGDGSAYNLGTEFYVTDDGCTLTAVRAWCPAAVEGVRVGRLYQVAGAQVGPASAAVPAVEGQWAVCSFDEPIALAPGTRYVATVVIPNAGQYAATGGFFASGPGATDHVTGPVVVPTDSLGGPGQGSFRVGATPGAPDGSFGDGFYWIVPVVEHADAPAGPVVTVTTVDGEAPAVIEGVWDGSTVRPTTTLEVI